MKREIITLSILIISLCSCHTHNNMDSDFAYTINIDDAITVDAPLISEFCSSASTIILESTNGSLLSSIDKIVNANNKLYIFDKNIYNGGGGFVVEFGMDGKFIRRYGSVGRGPGEYIDISDFTVDENNNRLYLLDNQTDRVLSYDLNNGKFVEDISVGKQGVFSSNSICCVGDLLYSDLNYWDFNNSNYMLKSWNKTDPKIENFFLTVGEHLKGWTNTTFVNNSNFIYNIHNEYSLFSNKYSNEIFKLTPDGVTNYIHVESNYFVGEEDRRKLSEYSPADNTYQILRDMNRFHEVRDYFETDRDICFMVFPRNNSYPIFVFDKKSGEITMSGYIKMDLLVKSGVQGINISFSRADGNGIYYCAQPRVLDKLATAAREGMLAENLDRLEEIKQLTEDSNPVIFYMKFKEPMK